MGLESADPVVKDKNNLNASREQVLEAVRIVNEIGCARGADGLPKVLPGLNLICGLDGETDSTYDADLELLRTIRDEGLLLRRINIRQVIPSRKVFGVKVDTGRFKRFKETVRTEIDRPILEKVVPRGTILRGVYMEVRDGNVTFGRQPGSYPLLVGVPYPVDIGTKYDVVVTDWGYRSVTGLTYPFDINAMPMTAVGTLPGIGRKRAAQIIRARPFADYEEFVRALDDPRVADGLKNILTFGGNRRRGDIPPPSVPSFLFPGFGGLSAFLFLAVGEVHSLGVHRIDGDDVLPFLQIHELDALGVASGLTDLGDLHADELARTGEDHELVVGRHLAYADDLAVALGGLDGDDPLPAAVGETVVRHQGDLSETVLGDGQQKVVGTDDGHGDDLVMQSDRHSPHAAGVPAHGPYLLLGEPAGETGTGGQYDLLGPVGFPYLHEGVVIVEVYGLDALVAYVTVL